MVNLGFQSVLGVNIHAVDYEYAVQKIVQCAQNELPLAVSALAVHGVMTGVLDQMLLRRLNGLDLVVPDGQPVRWALSWLHKKRLSDRVYGPNLTLRSAEALAKKELPIYLYGSTRKVLEKFAENLDKKFANLKIAGMKPSLFRQVSEVEQKEIALEIKSSGAKAVFVGLGCPRQEIWVFENRRWLNMPLLAVGAAFDFHAGLLPQAPPQLQSLGLEWAFRLYQEPKRLWKRYLYLNPLYLIHIAFQKSGLRKYPAILPNGTETFLGYA